MANRNIFDLLKKAESSDNDLAFLFDTYESLLVTQPEPMFTICKKKLLMVSVSESLCTDEYLKSTINKLNTIRSKFQFADLVLQEKINTKGVVVYIDILLDDLHHNKNKLTSDCMLFLNILWKLK